MALALLSIEIAPPDYHAIMVYEELFRNPEDRRNVPSSVILKKESVRKMKYFQPTQ
jgi:hypothetical protein